MKKKNFPFFNKEKCKKWRKCCPKFSKRFCPMGTDFSNINKIIIDVYNDEPNNEKNKIVTHYGVTCDGCNQYPIKGKRFKCNNCKDFDFCENCIKKKRRITWKKTHNFTTINYPIGSPQYWNDFLKEVVPSELNKQNDLKKQEKKEEIISLNNEEKKISRN